MEIVYSLILNVALLFIMMMPGVIMKKCGLSQDGFGKGLSNLVLYVAQPALIFLAYVRPFDSEILKNAVVVLVLSVIAHALFSIITLMCFKKAKDSARRMLRFATIFSNAAFMGIPLIDQLLGGVATLYASVYNITFNMFLWTLGVYICTSDRDEDGDGFVDGDVRRGVEAIDDDGNGTIDRYVKKKKASSSFLKVLIHPVTLAAALGLVFFFLPIESYIPKLAMDSLTMLKNLVAPLSMIVLGLRVADIDLTGFFKDKHIYLFLALRHAVLPILVFLVMRMLQICGVNISETVFLVTLILAAAPAATSATMFAEKYDCDAAYVSKIVVFSTIISIATMPLIVMLTNI